MDALEWDEEEIITRDRRWPPGTVRVTGAPMVQIIGAPSIVEEVRVDDAVMLEDADIELVEDESIDPMIDVVLLDENDASQVVALALHEPAASPHQVAPQQIEPARAEEHSMLPQEWALATQQKLPAVKPKVDRPVDLLRDSGAFVAQHFRQREPFPPDDDSLVPSTVAPSPRRRAARPSPTRWLLAAALLACVAALISWRLSASHGTLRVEVAGGPATVNVLVDGELRCEATPCVLSDLEPGVRDVAIASGGGEPKSVGHYEVKAGSETQVLVSLEKPEPPARASQRLSLDSTLSGVRVLVDGIPRGTLPLTLEDVTIGEHLLRFEAERRHPMETTVIVAPGETLRLHDVKLELASGALTVDVATPGAHVMLGRQNQPWSRKGVFGPFPKTIELDPSVSWEVVAGRYGFRPMIAPVILDEGGRASVTVELEQLPFGWDGDIYE